MAEEASTTVQLVGPPAPLARGPVLVRVTSGPDAGKFARVDQPRTVGTSEGCDLVMTDPAVSRRHMVFEPSDRGVRVRDEASRNGTWDGERRIYDVELTVGAELRIGQSVLRVEADTEAKLKLPELRASERATSFGRFLGAAQVLQPVYARLKKAAATQAPVLLEGESGAGKELLAEAIHEHSPRAKKPFVVVDCGAIPENLIESELFGHVKGAFTGADTTRIGAFQAAHGGTIFLDELGELPLGMQTRLLRAIDRGQIKPVGGSKTVSVDVRVVAATNRNLEHEVEAGRFRLDLLHRIAVITVQVPALRQRLEDIELLAQHFVKQHGGDVAMLTPQLIQRLKTHTWRGNVREFRNHVERLVLFGLDEQPLAEGPSGAQPTSTLESLATSDLPYAAARARVLQAFTRTYVEHMLERHDGNVSRAAKAAEVARRHFQRLKQEP